MDSFGGMSGLMGNRGPRNFESVFKFTDLSPRTQLYMQQVNFNEFSITMYTFYGPTHDH